MLSDNDTDMSNATILDCPEISNATEDFLRSFAFWTEGIFLCGIGFPGKYLNDFSVPKFTFPCLATLQTKVTYVIPFFRVLWKCFEFLHFVWEINAKYV